jgi:hypothetical protein
LTDYGLTGVDFDAALLKDAEARALTRSIARWLYEQKDPTNGSDLVDGVEFRSRHGDDLRAWAVFERSDDGTISPHFSDIEPIELTPETPALQDALAVHQLRFG